MNKTILIEKLLAKWLKDEKIENQHLTYSIYKPITPIFSNYDDWKLASKDDYYKEIEETSLIDIGELCNYIENHIDEEYDFNELFKEYSNEEILINELYDDFSSTFNRMFENWKEECIKELTSK